MWRGTWACLAVGLAAVAGCTGIVGGGGDGEGQTTSPLDCGEPQLGASPMRRLTRWEYDNTVRDLVGDTTSPASGFVPEAVHFGFDNNAEGATFNAAAIEDYERAAREIAARATNDLDALLACDVASMGEDACVEAWLPTFGRKAFRRPLTDAEIERYGGFYADSKAAYGFVDALRMVLSAMLQSPHFLYRIELGVAEPSGENAVRLTPYETATRLSYLLWGTMPDDELLDAAEAGELATSDQVRAQAERMLTSPRGAEVITNFYGQWAHLDEVQNLQKEDPAFTPAIAALMQQEMEAFVEHVVLKGDATMGALLTSDVTFLNAQLAAYYGIDGVAGDEMTLVELDPARASGMLTQGALMAKLAHPELKSAVNRGLFVLEKLLCAPPPPPPNNIDATLPGFDPEATSRQQLEQKTSEGTCHACHVVMNEIGFAFGHFDELGRWEQDEHGLPVDTSATIEGTDIAGDYAGHEDLLAALAKSPQMHACVTVDWFRYAFGRDALEADEACTVQPSLDRFLETGGSIRELLLGLTESPAFLYRTKIDSEGGAP